MNKLVRNLTLAGLLGGSAVLGYVSITAPQRQEARPYDNRVAESYKRSEQPADEPKSETPEWYSALVALGALGIGYLLISRLVKKPLPIFGLTGQEDPYKRCEEPDKGK